MLMRIDNDKLIKKYFVDEKMYLCVAIFEYLIGKIIIPS